MTAQEFALRTLLQLLPMVPGLIAAVVLTLAAVAVLNFLSRNAWVDQKRFRLLGIFFGIGFAGRVRLACSWVRLIFTATFLACFDPLEYVNYAMVLLPGLVGVILDRGLQHRAEDLMWLGLQIMGLFSASLVCQFVKDMSGTPMFILIYVAMALFLLMFSVYLFLNDLGSISELRSIDPDDVWAQDLRGENDGISESE